MTKKIQIKILIKFIFLILVFKAHQLYGASPITVAISNFKTLGGGTEKDFLGASCTEAIFEILTNDHTVRVVEREYLNKIIEEVKLQNSGLVDEKTAIETGRLLGVQYFVFGSITALNETIKISTRTVSVTTGQVISSNSVNGSINNLFNLQSELAKKITASFNIGNSLLQASNNSNADLSDIPLQVYNKLDKVKALAKTFPIFGLDPARTRKKAEYQNGINYCDEIIETSPKLYLAYYYKAQFLLQLENNEEAEAAIKIAKKLNSADLDIMLLNASYHMINNDDNKALDLLTFLSNKYPEDARIWYGIAKTQASALNNHAAIEACINALIYTPKIPQVEKLLQTVLGGMQGVSAAQFSSNDVYVFAQFYKTFFDFGVSKTTADLAKQVNQLWPAMYLPYYVMGTYQANLNKTELAEILLNDGLKYNNTYPYLHRELGKLLINSKKCRDGKMHLTIYMRTETSVDDYDQIQKYLNKCN
jgi:TolB-like protein